MFSTAACVAARTTNDFVSCFIKFERYVDFPVPAFPIMILISLVDCCNDIFPVLVFFITGLDARVVCCDDIFPVLVFFITGLDARVVCCDVDFSITITISLK